MFELGSQDVPRFIFIKCNVMLLSVRNKHCSFRGHPFPKKGMVRREKRMAKVSQQNKTQCNSIKMTDAPSR
jgi:hypothetical protein